MQVIESKKIKCKEYCLRYPLTVTEILEKFKKEFPKSSIVDIQISNPFVIFFYMNDIDLHQNENINADQDNNNCIK